jgi:hypothetical protein
MLNKDRENISNLYEEIILELSQTTINSALLKHQDIEDKNPVAKSRSKDFSERTKKLGEKKGFLIRTTTDPKSRTTSNYMNYYIEGASIEDDIINIKALMVDPYNVTKSKSTELEYYIGSNSLKPAPAAERGWGEKIWLLSRTDAENLSKTIKKYTGMNVSWKNMDFIHSADYSNQYADTRYDMSKLKE